MLDATQVSIAVTGAITKVPAALTITSASQDISAAVGAINYGFANGDGVVIATDTSTNNIVAWQNSSIVRVATTEASATYTFTLLQNTKEARELYHGATEDGTGKISYKPSSLTRGRFVIDYIDSDWEGEGEVLYGRHVINRGQVTNRGDIVLQNGEAIGYEVTITAFPDENGVVAEIFHGTATVEETPPA